MRRRFSLTALRAFEAAARCGSFAGAAEELCVTRPAVSKQIRLLEDELGCALFDRSSGTARLTALGTELYGGVVQSFDRLSATMERVHGQATGPDTLRILVEQDFASSWLADNIGRFLVMHPGISVEMVADTNATFRLDQDFNYRIFYMRPEEARVEALERHELCRWIDLPLCAPDYLETPAGDEAAALADAHLLHDRTHELWQQWLAAAGLGASVDVERGTIFNETSLCLSAAISGAGIAIGDSFLGFRSIRDGSLVAPFSRGLRSAEAYMLYRPRDAERSPAEAAFEQWLVEALSQYTNEVDRVLARIGVHVIE